MSRSYRKAIIKDKPKNYKISQFANRIIRRVESGYVRDILSLTDIETYNIPSRAEKYLEKVSCGYFSYYGENDSLEADFRNENKSFELKEYELKD